MIRGCNLEASLSSSPLATAEQWSVHFLAGFRSCRVLGLEASDDYSGSQRLSDTDQDDIGGA